MKLELTRKIEVEMEEYWVIRGVKDCGCKKEVVTEHVTYVEPTKEYIAEFLVDNQAKYGISFCSVEHNYRLKG